MSSGDQLSPDYDRIAQLEKQVEKLKTERDRLGKQLFVERRERGLKWATLREERQKRKGVPIPREQFLQLKGLYEAAKAACAEKDAALEAYLSAGYKETRRAASMLAKKALESTAGEGWVSPARFETLKRAAQHAVDFLNERYDDGWQDEECEAAANELKEALRKT